MFTVCCGNVDTPVASQLVQLYGVGVAPVVSLSAPGISFGSQLVGMISSAALVTLSNAGDTLWIDFAESARAEDMVFAGNQS